MLGSKLSLVFGRFGLYVIGWRLEQGVHVPWQAPPNLWPYRGQLLSKIKWLFYHFECDGRIRIWMFRHNQLHTDKMNNDQSTELFENLCEHVLPINACFVFLTEYAPSKTIGMNVRWTLVHVYGPYNWCVWPATGCTLTRTQSQLG